MADGIVRVGGLAKAGASGASPAYSLDTFGNLVTTDFYTDLLRRGHVYVAGDADENDVITGATSYAATTPTLLLQVPTGVTAIPLWVNLSQDGTVAGAVIRVIVSFDRADRYSSGGTSESITALRTDRVGATACKVYSTAGSAITASAATDARVLYSTLRDADVSAAVSTDTETSQKLQETIQQVRWNPSISLPPILVGPSSFLVFTYAGTTGPSWIWSLGFASFDSPAASQS